MNHDRCLNLDTRLSMLGEMSETMGNYDATIKALKATERNAWQLADSLFSEWSPADGKRLVASDYDCQHGTPDGEHQPDGSCCLKGAQRAAGLVPMPYNTARANREVAEFWPVSSRMDQISFTAHRAAKAAGGRKAALNALTATLNGVGGDPTRVTKAAVRAVVGESKSPRAGNARKGAPTLSMPKLTATLLGIRVNDNLAPLGDKELQAYVSALGAALDQATRHQTTRVGRVAGSSTKSTKSTKGTKAAKAAGTKAVPATARG